MDLIWILICSPAIFFMAWRLPSTTRLNRAAMHALHQRITVPNKTIKQKAKRKKLKEGIGFGSTTGLTSFKHSRTQNRSSPDFESDLNQPVPPSLSTQHDNTPNQSIPKTDHVDVYVEAKFRRSCNRCSPILHCYCRCHHQQRWRWRWMPNRPRLQSQRCLRAHYYHR